MNRDEAVAITRALREAAQGVTEAARLMEKAVAGMPRKDAIRREIPPMTFSGEELVTLLWMVSGDSIRSQIEASHSHYPGNRPGRLAATGALRGKLIRAVFPGDR